MRHSKHHDACPGTQSVTPERTTTRKACETEDPGDRSRKLARIHATGFTFPRSAFSGWEPLLPTSTETTLLYHLPDARPGDHFMLDLVDFSIYRPPHMTLRPHELTPLHDLNVNIGGSEELCFDGTVLLNGKKFYLQQVPFRILAVEGYTDLDVPSVTHGVSIQSKLGNRSNFWYKLGRPSGDYRRYHDTFLWTADLAKYVLEYLLAAIEKIGLAHFRADFVVWLRRTYGTFPKAQHWLAQFVGTDFRSAVSVNIQYIWKEAWDIDRTLADHPLWAETNPDQMSAVPSYCWLPGYTTVTPFVKQAFGGMSLDALLRCPTRSAEQNRLVSQRRRSLRLTPRETITTKQPVLDLRRPAKAFAVGDVVCVRPGADAGWKSEDKIWFAYVQSVRMTRSGRTRLDLIWLYRAADTSIGCCDYSIQNELFMSDNCVCGSDAIDPDQIAGKIAVDFQSLDAAHSAKCNKFIVRQTYMTHSHEFVTLDQSHFFCACRDRRLSKTDMVEAYEEALVEYREGDFVLYRNTHLTMEGLKESNVLEPAQIFAFDPISKSVQLRRLPRSARDLGHLDALPNQVHWSSEILDTPAHNLVRRCTVQAFRTLRELTELFRRKGVGDLFFYLSASITSKDSPPSINSPARSKLRGMGICCGGGSFDRGLEDGGAVTFEHAIDYDTTAVHTYRANADHPDRMNLFLGPMERYLHDSLVNQSTKYGKAAVGSVDVIAAGSPCQSFSSLQADSSSARSFKHASLIACVLSYVEHFMPLYFLLENVVAISHIPQGGSADQNMLSRIISTLVALGYQVQQHILDAPAFGSFQSRQRVILTATAPGLDPPRRPPQSHLSRPEGQPFRLTTLGVLANGQRFGSSYDELAPFPTVTFHQGTKDLPQIGDGHVYACIPYPDHRQGVRLNYMQRRTMALIPKYPPGQTMAQAALSGKIPQPQLDRWFKNKSRSAPHSKMFSRHKRDGLIGTVTTVQATMCAYNGACIHPEQNRLMTVMEARRAQGFPDHEVILGTLQQQWRIIGNSVHRNVAFALGVSLRESWERSWSVAEGIVGVDGGAVAVAVSAEGAPEERGHGGDDDGDVPEQVLCATKPVREPVVVVVRAQVSSKSSTGVVDVDNGVIKAVENTHDLEPTPGLDMRASSCEKRLRNTDTKNEGQDTRMTIPDVAGNSPQWRPANEASVVMGDDYGEEDTSRVTIKQTTTTVITTTTTVRTIVTTSH
ncbi:DNA (cytosine-5)-methyltransferase 3 [Sphaceloma murrayae]|uniref:DNA (cytosine-5-)-methyltransferase n=1 Tax=Sphaceloma murrayae TaxID=2082308 RepID=A0A2K1R2Z7_9PEZI|nr:DNA (cytosine-5)-methyltransferase 3 [Sphaceloma murrayae]